MRAHADEDIILPRPHPFLDFDQEALPFATSRSSVDSANENSLVSQSLALFRIGFDSWHPTRIYPDMQCTGIYNFRVRAPPPEI